MRRRAVVSLIAFAATTLLGAALGWFVAGEREDKAAYSIGAGGGQAAHSELGVVVSGDLGPGLAPGRTIPLDLELHNDSDRTVVVRDLTVEVSDVHTASTSTRECRVTEFVVRPLADRAQVRLEPGQRRRLSGTDLEPAQWPAIAMRDRDIAQDHCQDTRLSLRYRAEGDRDPR